MSKAVQTTSSEEATLSSRGYSLVKKLGEGSYAKVYLSEYSKGKDKKNPQLLACKIVDTMKAPKEFVNKFLPRELEVLIKLNHPHVIGVHSVFQRKSKYFIFMRFAERGDLLEFILRKGSISEGQARVWLRQMAVALQYLHEMEIAHRDLKCENALVTSNYNLKLADFGFARYVIDSKGKRVTSDTYCGSLTYAAPEILRGMPYHPKMADMWSLGVILFIMLNKAMPFEENNMKRLYEQQINKRWRFRAKIADTLSSEVKKLQISLLEPETSKRWTANQVVSCEWFAMDPRLVKLSPAEQAALDSVKEEKKRYLESSKKTEKKKEIQEEDVTVIKHLESSDLIHHNASEILEG